MSLLFFFFIHVTVSLDIFFIVILFCHVIVILDIHVIIILFIHDTNVPQYEQAFSPQRLQNWETPKTPEGIVSKICIFNVLLLTPVMQNTVPLHEVPTGFFSKGGHCISWGEGG